MITIVAAFITVMIAILVFVLISIGVIAETEEGPRVATGMAIVIAGKGGG
jgi:hypothetical protein